MAILQEKKKFILAKIESSYGTDPTPVNTDAIETRGLQWTPYDGNRVMNEIDRSVLGGYSEINVGPNVGVTFNVGMQGAGAAGTAPAYGSLLRACGLAQTINAGVSVVYAPVSSSFESITAYAFNDGMRQIVKGIRGSLTGQLSRAQLPTFGLSLRGLYARPTTPAGVTPDITDFFAPIPVTKTNTPTISILGYTGAQLESFSFDFQNEVIYRNTTNVEEVFINDRNVVGQLVVAAPDLATKDFFADVESHSTLTTGALQIIHGTTAGRIVQFDAPKVQLASIARGNVDGLVTYTFDVKFLPNAGNDELSITVK